MAGWIKLHRKIQNSKMYIALTSKQRDVLIQILLLANHEENDWEWGAELYSCKPGQFITSLESLCQKCAKDVKLQSVRTALLKLEKWHFLTNISTKNGRLITVLNWETYQQEQDNINNGINKEPTKSQQRANKELTTNKNIKNIKNVKNEEEYNKKENILKEKFEIFRKKYPGSKRGLDSEFTNFIKKHSDYKNVIELLLPAIEREINHHKECQNTKIFCPQYKNLQTWINNRCWETEFGKIETNNNQINNNKAIEEL